jgi:outer membrane biosynthesis protein TonB
LSAQLQSIQEKRRSLKTVIDLFAPTDTATATPIATPAQTPVAEESAEVTNEQTESTAEDVVTLELDTPKPDTTADAKAPTVPATTKRQAKKNSAPASKKQSAKSKSQKTSKELETWSDYLRDEFSDAILSQAVSEVMQRQPEQVLETKVSDLRTHS